jgi:hypothetical protein
MSTTQLFTEQNIIFNDKIVDNSIVPILIIDAKSGILNLTGISAPICQEEHEFIFMVDCSGSMSDECSDGRDKMQHIIHTLKNMILYFKENPDIKVHITINSFDDKIYNVLERSSITEDNYNEIISKVNTISPKGSTNIQLALKRIADLATQIKTDFPTHNISNIFMTDGDATAGETNHTKLAQLIDKTIHNYFIGFGIDHDTTLLNSISNNVNSGYYFIDKLENAGLVYGEILHGIIYKYLKNVNITIENGFLYDFKNNVWTDNLHIGEIVSEANKIYHIVSNNHIECRVNLTGVNISDNSNIQITIKCQEEYQDLTKYIYRQRTLQLLYNVNDFLKRKNDNSYSVSIFKYDNNNDSRLLLKEEQVDIKNKLKLFIDEMQKFMVNNKLDDDKFMKSLCDDIYVCYRTFDTKYGAMYTTSRQTSQGSQRCYTVSHTSCTETPSRNNVRSLRPPTLTRQVNRTYNNTRSTNSVPDLDDLFISDSDNDVNYEISGFEDSPYSTRSATQTMRDISGGGGAIGGSDCNFNLSDSEEDK